MRAFCMGAALAIAGAAFACGSGGTEGDTTAQGATSADVATARQMLDLVGGPDGKCKTCHSASPSDVKRWGLAMQAVSTCLSAAEAGPAPIDCLRDEASGAEPSFSPQKLGLYAAGAPLGEFDALFASPDDAAAFRDAAGMPRGAAPLAASEWAALKAWVLRGMPGLDQATSPDAGAAGTCTPSVTDELRAHVARMQTEGWGARLADLGTPMLGCGAATTATDCLTAFDDATSTLGAGGVAQTIRKLRDLDGKTNFWARSSADGRYVGVGGAPGRIFDLASKDSKPITVKAIFDPFFLRSNDGFAFAGAGQIGGISLCKQSLISDAESMAEPHITMDEPKCATVGVSIYESIGSALDGATYFMTEGPHRNDDGANTVTHPLPADYGAKAITTFIPMVNDGTAYRAGARVALNLPGEGDTMLSASSLLAATRFGDASAGGRQLGYRIHLVQATPKGKTYDIQAPLAAEVCLKGGKPEMSFDERFLAVHQYADPNDPDLSSVPDGSSNIVVADVLSGKSVRITTMAAGQFALYPHFRADGWLYFLVRDTIAGRETLYASDAALRMPNSEGK